jgi:hypothetical protein
MTILQKQSSDTAATDRPGRADTSSAMPMKLCVTQMRWTTKRLPRNRRNGNEPTRSTAGSAKGPTSKGKWARKPHGALIKPRPRGTLVWRHSDRRMMMARVFDDRPRPLVLMLGTFPFTLPNDLAARQRRQLHELGQAA